MHEKIKDELLTKQHDQMQDIETKLRHSEQFANELLLELKLTKKALYFAAYDSMLSKYHDRKEAAKEVVGCMKNYMVKANNSPDPAEVAL